jgi:hypothetical protein
VDSITGLIQALGAGVGGILIALTGFIGMVRKGNAEARKRITELERKGGLLERRVMQAHGIIIRMRLVLVAHGWMTDPDLMQQADDVLAAAERGDTE